LINPMKTKIQRLPFAGPLLRSMLVLFVLAGLSVTPLLAQNPAPLPSPPSLTLKEVQERLRANDKLVEEVRTRGRAGDAPGAQRAAENYQRSMEGLQQAMEKSEFKGSARDQRRANEAVEKATQRHVQVLTNLRDRVPAAARPGIENALNASQKGRAHALKRLGKDDEAAATGPRSGPGRPEGRPDQAEANRRPDSAGSAAQRPSERPSGPPSGAPGGGRGR